jgi:hypothetical protein
MSLKQDREKQLRALQTAMRQADKARTSNRKLREKYRDDKKLQARVRESLIADLKRVFADVANPYRGFAASRQRYRKLGHYPEIMVEDFFGNHEEFQRAADLRDSRETTKVRNKAAKLHTHQQIAQYAQTHVLKHTGLYDSTAKFKNKTSVDIVVGSDFHSYFVDLFALDVFIETIKMVNPEIVILNGDVFDFPQISRHRQMPGHFHLNLHQERQYGQKEILRRVREAAPNATIYYIIGNHEYRLVTYLADCAPRMAGLPELEFDTFLGIHEFEMSLVCQSNFLAPTAKARANDKRQNWLMLFDCYVATHGTSCAKFAADVEMNGSFRMSGTSGHTHRPQLLTSNSLGTGAISWMSTPMLAGFAVGRDYVSTPSSWNMGFGVVSINPQKRLVSQQLVVVHENWASFGGKTWTPTEKALARRKEQWSV